MGAEAIAGTNPYAAAAQAGAGVLQMGIGAIQSAVGNARLKRLMQQRTAYTTPQEYFDANNMALNAAQSGYSAQSMSYLTNQTDRALSSSLGTVSKMGGDPNDVAAIFDRSVQAIMKTTSDNELLKMQKFNKVYETVNTLAKERTAEWADKEAILKDKMAAEAMKVAAGNKNQESGLNMALGAGANKAIGNLFPQTTSVTTDALAPLSPVVGRYNVPSVTIPASLQQYLKSNPYGPTTPMNPNGPVNDINYYYP